MLNSSDGAKSSVRRAPRKRAVRKRAASNETEQRKVAVPTPPPEKIETTSERKAPTNFSATRTSRKQNRRQLIVVAVLLAIGVGASAAVGVTDVGQIDVQQTIESRNERIKSDQATEQDKAEGGIVVPVQNRSKKPDGGLVGLGNLNPPPEVATSTEAVATSTTAIDEGETSEVEATATTTTESE